MRTTTAWAFWRRVQYVSGLAVIACGILFLAYYAFLYAPATCFDGTQNGDEIGVDCGGACVRICALSVTQPQVEWARSFKIVNGQYNAVAYVANKNTGAASPSVRYTFSLYDANGLITERSGTTILPPDSVYPIFEGRIETGSRTPTRTLLDLETPDTWVPVTTGADQFTVVERTLSDVENTPRLDAVIRNNELTEAQNVEVIATIFDRERNALTSSRTVVDTLASRVDTPIVFTWPEPIAKTIRSCAAPVDVLLAIDLSGSMNNDGGNPPQPISAVLRAAEQFASRLGEEDYAGIVTFASDALLSASLSADVTRIALSIATLSIDPTEESGTTNTGDAFTRAREEFSSERIRAEARSVLVILTDGLATAPEDDPEAHARTEAEALKALGVEVYAIGLGEQVNQTFIEEIATDPAHAYRALSSNDIDRIYQTITSSLCEEGPATIEIIAKSDAGFVEIE